MDLDHYLRWCSEVFGLKSESVEMSADFTNAYYGGNHPRGTRIMFINGNCVSYIYLCIDLVSCRCALEMFYSFLIFRVN